MEVERDERKVLEDSSHPSKHSFLFLLPTVATLLECHSSVHNSFSVQYFLVFVQLLNYYFSILCQTT